MNTFVEALDNAEETFTQNGMSALSTSCSKAVDLFFAAGASRGKNILSQFEGVYQENPEVAIRLVQWMRDIRGGAGERKLFRDVLVHLERLHPEVLLKTKLLENVPVIGRWDDLLVFQKDHRVVEKAFGLIRDAILSGDGLACKWMPRKGPDAIRLRNFMGLSPKSYRKTLVNGTNVVETALCNKEFEKINYSHVPSLAMSRYMTAFHRNDTARFVNYRESLKRGDAGVKVNAGAVYPYDVIKTINSGGDAGVADAMWKALPNYLGDQSILPMVDVSGSMVCAVSGSTTALDVAVSLGLYCSDKNQGAFKDVFLTFSGSPELIKLRGSLSSKLAQMQRSDWGMNTNLESAFNRILDHATKNKVSQSDMPNYLLILSDMQFDACCSGRNAFKMVQKKYENAGYTMPAIIFWNIRSYGKTIPGVTFDQKGTALVSGFSPSVMKSVLSCDMSVITPQGVMWETIGVPRYNVWG